MEAVRDRLIEATFQEVYSKGYHAASLSHILNAAKVKKGAMYHYFPSKKEMVLTMIEEKVEKRIKDFWLKLEDINENIIDFLVAILKDTTNKDFKRGCPLGNLLQETLTEDKDFSQLLKKITDEWQELFENSLQKAVTNNEIQNIDIKATALFIIASLEGAILLSKNSVTTYEFDSCMKQLELYLKMFKIN